MRHINSIHSTRQTQMHDIDNWSERMALRAEMVLSKVLGKVKKIFGKREDISPSQNKRKSEETSSITKVERN